MGEKVERNKRNRIILTALVGLGILGILVIVAITNQVVEKLGLNIEYEEGFLKEDDESLKLFMESFLLSGMEYVTTTKGYDIYMVNSPIEESNNVEYIKIKEGNLQKHYKSSLTATDKPQKLKELKDTVHDVIETVNNIEEYGISNIVKDEENKIHIEKDGKEINVNLVELRGDIKKDTKLNMTLQRDSENGYIIGLEDRTKKTRHTLLVSKDNIKSYLYRDYPGDIDRLVNKGKLKKYYNLFEEVTEGKSRYIKNITEQTSLIIDTRTDSVITVNENDYMSNDEEYVYLEGNIGDEHYSSPVTRGEVKIQKTTDYIKDRKKVNRSLNISIRKISKVSQGLEEAGNTYENIIYFNKDLIVADVLVPLFPIGADKTTLTIDLKDRRPKIHVEELGLKQEDFKDSNN